MSSSSSSRPRRFRFFPPWALPAGGFVASILIAQLISDWSQKDVLQVGGVLGVLWTLAILGQHGVAWSRRRVAAKQAREAERDRALAEASRQVSELRERLAVVEHRERPDLSEIVDARVKALLATRPTASSMPSTSGVDPRVRSLGQARAIAPGGGRAAIDGTATGALPARVAGNALAPLAAALPKLELDFDEIGKSMQVLAQHAAELSNLRPAISAPSGMTNHTHTTETHKAQDSRDA